MEKINYLIMKTVSTFRYWLDVVEIKTQYYYKIYKNHLNNK